MTNKQGHWQHGIWGNEQLESTRNNLLRRFYQNPRRWTGLKFLSSTFAWPGTIASTGQLSESNLWSPNFYLTRRLCLGVVVPVHRLQHFSVPTFAWPETRSQRGAPLTPIFCSAHGSRGVIYFSPKRGCNEHTNALASRHVHEKVKLPNLTAKHSPCMKLLENTTYPTCRSDRFGLELWKQGLKEFQIKLTLVATLLVLAPTPEKARKQDCSGLVTFFLIGVFHWTWMSNRFHDVCGHSLFCALEGQLQLCPPVVVALGDNTCWQFWF